jgi:hypothetical protein
LKSPVSSIYKKSFRPKYAFNSQARPSFALVTTNPILSDYRSSARFDTRELATAPSIAPASAGEPAELTID